jgi:hypothetical protein
VGFEPHPSHQASKEAVALTTLFESLYHLTVEELEVARTPKTPTIRSLTHESIESTRHESITKGLTTARSLDCADNLSPVLPCLDHLWDQFRRVLQVGVQEDDRLTSSVIQPRCHGRLFSKIPRKLNEDDPVISLRQKLYPPSSLIPASIINAQDLKTFARAAELSADCPHGVIDNRFLIVHGQ